MTNPDIKTTFLKRKCIGEFLKMFYDEHLDLPPDDSTWSFDPKHRTYNIFLKNENNETITAIFNFYKTGWRVKLDTDGYSSPILGKIPKTDRSFQISKELADFINETKYSKMSTEKEIDGCSPFETIVSLKTRLKKLLIDNEACINRINKNIDYPVLNIITDFTPDDEELTILNLFKLFSNVDKMANDGLHKDLALYVIADEIFNIKYKMVGLERKSYEPRQGFEIQAKSQPFAYAHVLQFYGGKCKWLHGHNGEIVIKASVPKDTIEKRPMFLSYGFLKAFLKYMDKCLDHKTFWALNPESHYTELIGGSFKVDTPKQTIVFHDKEGHTLLPYLNNSCPFSTSEVTLFNYVLPHFLIYMIRFHIENSGPDSTHLAFCDLSELIKFSFSWYETETTVCTVSSNC